jgi:hypothetical protein
VQLLRLYFDALRKHWVSIATGSTISAIVGLLGLFALLPSWAIGTFIITFGLLFASFSVWKEEHLARVKVEESLRPILEIDSVPSEPLANGYRRIKVWNRSAHQVRFIARLESIKPGWGVHVPVELSATHGKEIIPARSFAQVDFYLDREELVFPPGYLPVIPVQPGSAAPLPEGVRRERILALLPIYDGRSFRHQLPRQRYELVLSVSPIDPNGVGDKRRFYVTPQPNGDLIFGDGGRVA